MFTALLVLSGVCWMVVYFECIRLGFKDKTYAMPFFALGLNIAWEGLYAYVYLTVPAPPGVDWFVPQGLISALWFFFDVVILYTFYKYGRKEFAKHSTEAAFVPYTVLVLVMSLATQIAFYVQFGLEGPLYAAFVQNLIMSVAYIGMLAERKSSKGQNLNIAVAKFIGTLCATIYCGVLQPYIVALVLGAFCAIFDVIYILRLRRVIQDERASASGIPG